MMKLKQMKLKGQFQYYDLTEEEKEFKQKQEEYVKPFIPKDMKLIRINQKEGHKFPYSFTYCPIDEDVRFHSGYYTLTPYGIKLDILEEMKRNNIVNIQKRREYSFDTYIDKENWQKAIKKNAMDYVDNFDGNKWFAITGISGSGKSHIATSVVFGLASRGIKVDYISWVHFKNTLKNDLNDAGSKTNYIMTRPILYIDDFLKVGVDEKAPTSFELEQAVNIIWYRYDNNLPTIISTEFDLEVDINNFSRAIAGRIIEMAKGYTNVIGNDSNRNYRLHGDF